MGNFRRRHSLWAPYVPVAERRRKAENRIAALKKKGSVLKPVIIEGRAIAKTFWGKAWCNNLEAYSDFENRLPRGRTYVRNGSVIDLHVAKGNVLAQVMGSSLYQVEISIRPMDPDKWQDLVRTCSGKIDSLIELLQGKFSKAVMEILTEEKNGLFPKPHEITMKCSCPDYAGMCKHIAATLYGVGAFLDEAPEHLFQLRHVDHLDLIASASTSDVLQPAHAAVEGLAESELSSVFGIEIDMGKSDLSAASLSQSVIVPANDSLEQSKSSRARGQGKRKKKEQPIEVRTTAASLKRSTSKEKSSTSAQKRAKNSKNKALVLFPKSPYQ